MLQKLIRWFPFIFPLYLIRFTVGPLPTTLLEILFSGILIASLLPKNHSIWKHGWEQSKPWHRPIGLWILATTIAIIVAPNHIAALGLWRAYILEPILFGILLLGSIHTKKDKQDTIKALIASSFLIAIYSIIQFIFNVGIPHPWNVDILHRRATGPFGFPNAVSLFCAPIAALCAGMILLKETDKEQRSGRITMRPYAIIGFVAALTATLLAKSVGGLIAIGTATFIALTLNQRTRKGTIILSLILAAIVGFTPSLRTPIVRDLSFGDWSGKVRLIIWKETKAMLADRPLQGAGLGAYPTVIKPYHTAKWMEIFQYPHNILLNLWSETGILGILAFTWICITWIKLTIKAHDHAPLQYLLPLIAILIHGLVDVPYFKNDLAMSFFTLAALATTSIKKDP